jgi:hypothetical protein
MTTFDKREEGFEKKFAHDEELRFKATARRNKLVGLWAAAKLALTGAAAEAYAKDVVAADLEHPGSENVLGKLRNDYNEKGVALTDAEIRQVMNELLAKQWHKIRLATNGRRASARLPLTSLCAFQASAENDDGRPSRRDWSKWPTAAPRIRRPNGAPGTSFKAGESGASIS